MTPTAADARAAGLRSTAVRQARAAVKRRVRTAPTVEASRQVAADIVEDPPADCGDMELGELLRAIYPSNLQKMRFLLAVTRIWHESLTLDALVPRQRSALVAKLRGCATVEEIIAGASPPERRRSIVAGDREPTAAWSRQPGRGRS